MSGYRILNTRAPKIDAAAKVTGQAVYTDDMVLPRMLRGAILHSPLPHARIIHLDLTRARQLPGVHAVIGPDEAGATKFGVSPARYDETVFAADRVRYVGDEVAAVAAEDLETALEALARIEVEYEELPAVFDAHGAMADGAPLLHAEYRGNVCARVEQHFGDVDAARASAHAVVSGRLNSKMQDGAFLEPQAALARLDSRGDLTLWSSTQVPHYVQRTVAMVMGIPEGRVRVIKPAVGGGFGPKAAASSMELITCLLARETGRPVKTVMSREQVFLHSRARHQFFHTMTTGINGDGSLAFLDHHNVMDGGAYASFGIASVYYAGSLLGGPYKLPNMRYEGYRVVTNRTPCGAQRGHGAVIARALFERQLDELAEKIGMDPVDVRLKNMMEAGDVTCNELNMSSLGMRECVEGVRDRSGWSERRSGTPGGGRGMGMACGFFVSGAGYPIYRSKTFHCTVLIKLAEVGGKVHLLSGSADIGQGSDTAFAMIAAEILGIELADVDVQSGDSSLAIDLGAYSSRQTLMTGHATREAAESVRDQVLAVIAGRMDVPAGDLSLDDGVVKVRGEAGEFEALRTEYLREHRGYLDNPDEPFLTFREASRLAFLEQGAIVGVGKYRPPPLGGSYKGAAVGTSPAYGCSAQVVEVDVDLETGKIDVLRMVDAHDCGFAINRTSVEGQMQGSLCMGLGEALYEEVKFGDRGQLINGNLADYKIPTAMDMPNVETIVVESHEPNGPFGAKEVGEGAIMPTIPALLNAIHDATGVRYDELPLTPERILAGLKAKHEGGDG
jgi:4-hydroxybenzoyl-CoA reductase alpha subunit